MTARDTKLLLAVLALVGAALTAGLVARATPGPVPRPPAHDGMVLRGVRSARVVAGHRVVEVAAAEVRLERTRVGPFRLGFARTLTARDARIEVRDGPRHAAPAAAPRVRTGKRPARALAGVRVDGLRVVVWGRTGAARLTLRASGCTADVWTGGAVECRGVRIRGDGVDQRVARLGWDPTTRRFSAGGAGTAAVDAVGRHLTGLPTDEIAAALEAFRAQLEPRRATG